MLQAALVDFHHQLNAIDKVMAEIRATLGKAGPRFGPVSKVQATRPQRRNRVLSPSARKRIAVAQKKRWTEYRAKKAEHDR